MPPKNSRKSLNESFNTSRVNTRATARNNNNMSQQQSSNTILTPGSNTTLGSTLPLNTNSSSISDDPYVATPNLDELHRNQIIQDVITVISSRDTTLTDDQVIQEINNKLIFANKFSVPNRVLSRRGSLNLGVNTSSNNNNATLNLDSSMQISPNILRPPTQWNVNAIPDADNKSGSVDANALRTWVETALLTLQQTRLTDREYSGVNKLIEVANAAKEPNEIKTVLTFLLKDPSKRDAEVILQDIQERFRTSLTFIQALDKLRDVKMQGNKTFEVFNIQFTEALQTLRSTATRTGESMLSMRSIKEILFNAFKQDQQQRLIATFALDPKNMSNDDTLQAWWTTLRNQSLEKPSATVAAIGRSYSRSNNNRGNNNNNNKFSRGDNNNNTLSSTQLSNQSASNQSILSSQPPSGFIPASELSSQPSISNQQGSTPCYVCKSTGHYFSLCPIAWRTTPDNNNYSSIWLPDAHRWSGKSYVNPTGTPANSFRDRNNPPTTKFTCGNNLPSNYDQ